MQLRVFFTAVFLQTSCATATIFPQHEAMLTSTSTVVEPQASIDVEDLHDSHYVGIFQNDRLKKSFPAAMDLVVAHGKGNNWQLSGVLRIYAPAEAEGTSYRVISSYYDRIAVYDQELSFAAKHQRISVVKKGSWDEDKITAFVVVYGFGQGQLHLHKQARSDFNLPQPSTQQPLELADFKLQRTEFPQHVFAEQGKMKVETGLLNSSKNLLQRDLFDVNYASVDRFGTYYGVLHHEQLNAFQYLRLAFVEDRDRGVTTAISTLFFAKPQHKEFIVYRHHVGREVMRDATPLVLGNEDESEAFLLLNRWDSRGIGGVWYSKVYGRIGKIFLMREHFPRLETNATLMPSLRGPRQEARYAFELQVRNGVAQRVDTVFPAQISGTLNDVLQEKTYQITEGNYDFYRGLVELTYEGGSVFYSVFNPKPQQVLP